MTTFVDMAQDTFAHFCFEHCAAPASVDHAGQDFIVVKFVVHQLDVFVLLMNATERVAIRFADTAGCKPLAVGARVTLQAGLHLVSHAACESAARNAQRSRFWYWRRWLCRRSSAASSAHLRARTPRAHAES